MNYVYYIMPQTAGANFVIDDQITSRWLHVDCSVINSDVLVLIKSYFNVML